MGGGNSLDNILTSTASNSHLGKRPAAQDMMMFGSHVGPHVSEQIKFLLMIFSDLGRQVIPKADFWSFITAMWVRNPISWVPPTEGGIFEATW